MRKRLLGLLIVLSLLTLQVERAVHGQRPAPDEVLHVLPLWAGYVGSDDEAFARQVGELRRRIGSDNPRVRLGFATYIFLSMEDAGVDPERPDLIRKALAKTVAEIDLAIARARKHDIALCLSFLTAIRERTDPLQKAAEREDRRNVQWYADNTLASGWMTHSRYARKHRRALEAYVREVGRVVANRMARYPATFVAASGDGEVELAYGKSPFIDPKYTVETMQLADYSPFAIAEFRDWLRAEGLHAPRQSVAATAYEHAARYKGDGSPAADTNRDGHTLNGDFGTTFATWELRDFDWSLSDDPQRDPRAIPATAYETPDWKSRPNTRANGFDAPRTWKQGDAWWEVWHLFRQTMLRRHNQDFARWITSSPDPETKSLVPAARWYSDQIAADYLFGHTPDRPTLRFITSASSWWTADVAPYGRLGITSFNTNVNGNVFRTLAGVAPHIGNRDIDWGLLEWHPSAPPTKDLEVYRSEARLVQLYRPSLVVPIFWARELHPIEGSGFEVALRELVAAAGKGPLPPEMTATPARLNFAAASGRATPAQRLGIQIVGRGRVPWTLTTNDPSVVLSRASGDESTQVDVSLARGARLAGDRRVTLTLSAPRSSTPATSIPILLRGIDGAGAPPHGSIDAPGDGAASAGAFDAAGWALDDVGVVKVEVWREPLPGEKPEVNGLIRVMDAAPGPRADVAGLFPDAPLIQRAGWAARVDLSPLATTERRSIRIHVLVTDVEGNVANLGVRTVVVRR
jgi:hypothetical protein